MKKIVQQIIKEKLGFGLSIEGCDSDSRSHFQDIWEEFKDYEISFTVGFQFYVNLIKGGYMKEDELNLELLNVDLESMSLYSKKRDWDVELTTEEQQAIFKSFKFDL